MVIGDPFEPVVPLNRQHEHFRTVRDHWAYAPARALIRDLAHDFVDPDGNFIEQFQSTGFDARTWELFLFAFLRACGALVTRDHQQPDLQVALNGVELFLEAVTVNPSAKYPPPLASEHDTFSETLKHQHGAHAIKIASTLFSKLQADYGSLPHLQERPFVIAVENFGDSASIFRGSASLWQYLYGIRGFWYYDAHGQLRISETRVERHAHREKEIPSGFFNQPAAEVVSAVLFGNTGTMPKFNRMAVLNGYERPVGLRMLRKGTCYRHDANAAEPVTFAFEVGDPEAPVETWGEGLELFHNPRAANPLPYRLLPIAHHYYEDGRMRSFLPDFHPFGSITVILAAGDGG
jgi:hypothetical protein